MLPQVISELRPAAVGVVVGWPARMPDEGHGSVDDDSAPGRAQTREGGRAQGDRHPRVPRQVPEPGSISAAGTALREPSCMMTQAGV
jgi:hypothetical protein